MPDIDPPTFVSAVATYAAGATPTTKIRITFADASPPLTAAPNLNNFSLAINSNPFSSLDRIDQVAPLEYDLFLSATVLDPADEVTLNYAADSANFVEDSEGNALAPFDGEPVTNNVSVPGPGGGRTLGLGLGL